VAVIVLEKMCSLIVMMLVNTRKTTLSRQGPSKRFWSRR